MATKCGDIFQELLPKISSKEDLSLLTVLSKLQKLGSRSLLAVLNKAIDFFFTQDFKSSIFQAQTVLDFCWEKMNTGHWKDVDVVWRQTYSYASLFKALSFYENGEMSKALEACDMALLLGAPILDNVLCEFAKKIHNEVKMDEKYRTEDHSSENRLDSSTTEPSAKLESSGNSKTGDQLTLVGAIKTINNDVDDDEDIGCSEAKKIKNSNITLGNLATKSECDNSLCSEHGILPKSMGQNRIPTDVEYSKAVLHEEVEGRKTTKITHTPVVNPQMEIDHCTCPSILHFQNTYMKHEQPVIIEGTVDHWPAFNSHKWSLQYLKEKAGSRTVPVELGLRYTDESWTQKLMTVNEFIESYIVPSELGDIVEVAYLAQHQLFDQIPELQQDIVVPDYCCLGDREVMINAWFGPKGTISPLHHDPYNNLLTQVVGEKYIRLYSKEQTENVYPHETTLLNNTSQVDVEAPDLSVFPKIRDAVYQECILKAGQVLYIPTGYWHYVRSLSISFSVSFWW